MGSVSSYHVLDIGSSHASHYTLMDTGSAEAPQQYFGVSSASELMRDLHPQTSSTLHDFMRQGEPSTHASVGRLAVDITADVAHLHKLKEAAELVHVLEESAHAIHKSERPPAEAVTCQVAKVVAEKAFEVVGKGVVVGGVPLLITEAVAFPPLAAAIPVAAAALPQAYANMEALAKFAGEKAAADCHLLFSGEQ